MPLSASASTSCVPHSSRSTALAPGLSEARGYGESWGLERAAPFGGKASLPAHWCEGLLEALWFFHFVLGPCSESILVLVFFFSAWDRHGGRQVPGLGAVCVPPWGRGGHPRTPQGAPFWGRTGPEPLEQAAVSRPVPVTSRSPAPSSITAALSPFVSDRFCRCRCLDGAVGALWGP